jgi:hypothetical protein
MAQEVNLENGGEEFVIHLHPDGKLHFEANRGRQTRMVLDDDSGELAIGGSGAFGQLQLKGASGVNTVFIGGGASEATVLLGGASGQTGRVRLFDASTRATVDLDGRNGVLVLGNEGVDGNLLVLDNTAATAIRLDGDDRSLQLTDTSGNTRIDLRGAGQLMLQDSGRRVTAILDSQFCSLTLGAAGGSDGDIYLLDDTGAATISCDGQSGHVSCVSIFESGRLASPLAPLSRALEGVLGLRGGRFAGEQAGRSPTETGGDPPRALLGFVAEELEGAFPELVATNAEGRKAIHYSRMTVILVEAIKEQQQQLTEQATALAEAARKIASIEASLSAQAAQ